MPRLLPSLLLWFLGSVVSGHTANSARPNILRLPADDLSPNLTDLIGTPLLPQAAPDSVDASRAGRGDIAGGRKVFVEYQSGKTCGMRVGSWKWLQGPRHDLSAQKNLAREQPERAQAVATRLKVLRDTADPRGIGDGKTFDRPPFTDPNPAAGFNANRLLHGQIETLLHYECSKNKTHVRNPKIQFAVRRRTVRRRTVVDEGHGGRKGQAVRADTGIA